MVETTPSWRAVAATASGPTVWARRTAAVLTEWANASASVIGAAELAVEIGRLPAADPHRPVVDHVARPPAGLERGQIDERLEGRARLAMRVDRAVERARPMVAAADHGAHRTAGVEHHDRGLVDGHCAAAAASVRSTAGSVAALQPRSSVV